eukprot:scaffold2849_cov174-Amphora_coffeaeformis.AAC.17
MNLCIKGSLELLSPNLVSKERYPSCTAKDNWSNPDELPEHQVRGTHPIGGQDRPRSSLKAPFCFEHYCYRPILIPYTGSKSQTRRYGKNCSRFRRDFLMAKGDRFYMLHTHTWSTSTSPATQGRTGTLKNIRMMVGYCVIEELERLEIP